MAYRTPKLKGSECLLFFVGGNVAHAAWLATPWDPAWGKTSARLPDVMAEVQAPMLEDGVVFERVSSWPRAVRVTKAAPSSEGALVSVVTVAARDQPAGATADFSVHDQRVSGSLPVAEIVHPPPTIRIPTKTSLGVVHAVAFADAGVDVIESWQDGAFDAVVGHVTRDTFSKSPLRARIDASLKAVTSCDESGFCTGKDGDLPVNVALENKTPRITRIAIAHAPVVIVREPAPTPVSPNEGLVVLRMHESPGGTVRPLASVAIGEARLLVVADEKSMYIVEREGAYSHVTWLLMRQVEKLTADARIDDVNGDGIADAIVFAHWPKQKADDVYEAHAQAIAAIRGTTMKSDPTRDTMGVEVDMLGARDLDDAVKRAHQAFTSVPNPLPTKAEACSVLGKSITPSGLAKNATATARVISFDEPQSPSNVVRIVPASRANADDAALLKDMCSGDADGGFFCRGAWCGQLNYGLGSMFRFVRENRVLKLETALVYTGS